MKKTVKIVSVVLLLIMALGVAACGKADDDQASAEVVVHASSAELVGTWKGFGHEVSTLTLGADGSYIDVADELSIIGTYTVDSVSGTLTVNESEYGMVFTYSYELSGDELTLQLNGGLPRTFARQ